MKARFLLLLSIFSMMYLTAQEQQWNIEASYSIVPSEGFGGEDNVYELGVKYRFLQNEIANLGVGVHGGFFRDGFRFPGADDLQTHYIVQPRVFSEFHLPFSKRLKPSVGAGYSYLSGYGSSTDGFWGFNLNLGLTYNINDKWFVQFQYDRVSLKPVGNTEGFNNFRLGVGFRF